MLKNIKDHLEAKIHEFLGISAEYSFKYDSVVIKTSIVDLIKLLKFLRDDNESQFKVLVDIFAVDYPGRENRFELNYLLLSTKHNYRAAIKIDISETQNAISIISLYSAAQWLEREVWDMYGIKFTGNDDLRRILTDYEFEGHPMRKDFPLTGYKEVRYDAKKQKVIYEPVKLMQDYRNFDFESPWEGMNNVLPGDEKASAPLKEK